MNTPTIPTLPAFIPRKPNRYKPRVPVVPVAPPPQTLTLVSAYYDENVPVLSLVFDRAIDASAFVAAQVTVVDGSFDMGVYGGTGPAIVDSPTTISVNLVLLSSTGEAPVTMNASALTGLRAVDDGGTWAGVSGLGLPYDG